MLSRVRWQLTGWYVGVLLLVIAAVSGVAYVALARALGSEVDDSLRSSANDLVGQLQSDRQFFTPVDGSSNSGSGSSNSGRGNSNDDDDGRDDDDDHGEPEDDLHETLEYFRGTGNDVLYLVLAPDGSVVLNPLNVNATRLVDPAAVEQALGAGETWRTVENEDGGIRTLYVPALRNGEPIAVVQVGRSLESHDRQLADLLRVMLLTGGAGLLLATVGGFWLAGRALRPTRQAMTRQRQFVADASHELRTPLTLIRASAEAIQRTSARQLEDDDRSSLDDIVLEADRMSALVEELLLLAKLDEGRLDLHRSEIAAAELVEDAVRQARLLAAGKPLTIEAAARDAGRVDCDETRISQVLRILIANAVRHTPAGGRIEIGAQARGNQVEFWVGDSGPGIPEEHLGHLFERFYRADDHRARDDGGSGLGLSIARQLVEAHGGHIEARNTGSGAWFGFVLPR